MSDRRNFRGSQNSPAVKLEAIASPPIICTFSASAKIKIKGGKEKGLSDCFVSTCSSCKNLIAIKNDAVAKFKTRLGPSYLFLQSVT